MSAPAGVVTEQDVRAAQAAVDALDGLEVRSGIGGELELVLDLGPELRLGVRGVLASWASEVRYAGYLEGVQRGRQEAAHAVLDALRGEGLAP